MSERCEKISFPEKVIRTTETPPFFSSKTMATTFELSHALSFLNDYNASTNQTDLAPVMASVDYNLRVVIQEALKFTKHSKRQRLMPSDINKSLRQVGATPSYSGPSSRDPLALPLARASRAAQRADALIDDGGEEEDDISFESHPSFFYANRRIRLNDLKNINLPRLPLEPGKLRLIPALLVYLFGSPVPATTTTKSVPLLLTRWMFLCLTFLLFSFFFFLLLLSSSSTLDKLAGC